MRHLSLLLAIGTLVCIPAASRAASHRAGPGTVIVDASDFVQLMPARNILTEARPVSADNWLFNNSGMVLRAAEDSVARVQIATAGRYHLRVRTAGSRDGTFKIALGGQVAAATFGGTATTWTDGGAFDLPAGELEVRLTEVTPSPVLDVIVLTRDPAPDDEALRAVQFPAEVSLLREYRIPPAHAVKFGDLTGDGRMDFVVITPNYSIHAFDHDGRELWNHQAPPENTRLRGEFEAPGSVWDFDGDGRAEVVHWRMIDGQQWIAMADGTTGEVKHRVAWPAKPWPHVYNNFRTAVARQKPGRADSLVVLCDSGDTIAIAAYDAQLRELWRHDHVLRKDHLGHYIYPRDVTGDGVDEVIVSHLAYDAGGRQLWSNLGVFPVHHDHVDSFRFGDLDGDGRIEAMGAVSDIGTVVFDAQTGAIEWMRRANHTQQIEWGPFLEGVDGPQVVVNGRIYGDRAAGEPYLRGVLHYFTADGGAPRARSPWPEKNPVVSAYRQPGPPMGAFVQWPQNPLNGNPEIVKGDWRGDGVPRLFWHRFGMSEHGTGTLFFAQEVYHMFDYAGNGAEQVIALNKGQGILQVYGHRDVAPKAARRDSEYLRNQVTNHTHY
jgi:hypothetical protein